MEAAIPTEKAAEPQEEAQIQTKRAKEECKTQKYITFDKNYLEGNCSQNKYKDALSQPASELSHKEKLLWLQKRRSNGLWAQCDECDQWRYLPQVQDRHQLPQKWFCVMNPDKSFAKCSVPEEPCRIHDEEDLIHSEYSAGSIVWARIGGWPWWPAMVDDCPDTEQFYWLDGFSDIPTFYHVVFFDSCEVTRAWVATANMSPYIANKKKVNTELGGNKKFKQRILSAIAQADEAHKIPFSDRLMKYSFIARYNGKIGKPIKLNKRKAEEYNKKFLKKYNVSIDIVSEDEIDTVEAQKGTVSTCNSNIQEGTSKKQKVVEAADKNNNVEDQVMETDASVSETPVPNSDTTQIDSVKLKTPNTFVNTDSAKTANFVSETQDSFKVRIPTPSSEDFDF